MDDFCTILLVPLLSKRNKVPSDVYRALSLNIASEATKYTDKTTTSKRVSAFLRLCPLYIPCEYDDYEEAARVLDSEVDPDLHTAKLTLEIVQEQRMPAIVRAQNEAVSTMLQVLYFLQQGHVQFLMGDYKARILEAHGHDAFIVKVKTKKLGKDGLPRSIHDVDLSNQTPGQTVDMSQDDDEGALDSDDEGPEFHHNRDGEGEQANTHVPSTSQQEKPQPPMKGSILPKNSEAAGFGSDTSPRNETGDNEELSRAERK